MNLYTLGIFILLLVGIGLILLYLFAGLIDRVTDAFRNAQQRWCDRKKIRLVASENNGVIVLCLEKAFRATEEQIALVWPVWVVRKIMLFADPNARFYDPAVMTGTREEFRRLVAEHLVEWRVGQIFVPFSSYTPDHDQQKQMFDVVSHERMWSTGLAPLTEGAGA